MWKTTLLAGVCAVGLALPGPSAAHDHGGKPWIHIEVSEDGHDGANVKINLPLSLVDVALEVAENEAFVEGDLELDDCDVSVTDMRRMWNELRDAGDADFVTVEEDDERVRIHRKGDRVLVQVDDLRRDEEKVRIEVPISVVDALFDTDRDDALNLRGALAELQDTAMGEVLTVHDGSDHVRIWIDD